MPEPSTPEHEERFRALLAAHGVALRRLAAVYVRSPQDQQDLVQEIALALWTALPRFRGDSTERTWMYRVAHNVALTFKAKRRRHTMEHTLQDAHVVDGAHPQTRFDLYDLIRRLPAPDRQLVTLYLEGLTQAEIGDVMGLTPTNVGVRLMRLRQKLAAAAR